MPWVRRSALLLIDNSTWSRLLVGAVPRAPVEAVVGMLAADEIATCLPFMLEAGYPAARRPTTRRPWTDSPVCGPSRSMRRSRRALAGARASWHGRAAIAYSERPH